MEYVAEEGSPVEVVAARTDFDLDPFGAPIAARTYIDYKNVSGRRIHGVKFRIRYYDDTWKDRGTFHAPDAHLVEPGGMASQKFKSEKVDPRVVAAKIRTLMVRFADSTAWHSRKMPQIVTPEHPLGYPDPGESAERSPQPLTEKGEEKPVSQ